MVANGNGLGGSIKQGAGLAIGASLALGGIALTNHLLHRFFHFGIPHEFILWPRGCCSKHPHHHAVWHPHGRHMMAMNATMNTLGPGPDGRYHLY